jgi:OOP family OmpA-OmpF porin
MSQYALLEAVIADIGALRQTAAASNTRIHIDIFGHTDRTGREERNVELSQSRAQAVLTALEFQGVPAEIMRAAGVADAASGHTGPVAYPQELDRRVTFRVSLSRQPESRP